MVTYRPDFEQIWQEKKIRNDNKFIPELVTSGGAADHSPMKTLPTYLIQTQTLGGRGQSLESELFRQSETQF